MNSFPLLFIAKVQPHKPKKLAGWLCGKLRIEVIGQGELFVQVMGFPGWFATVIISGLLWVVSWLVTPSALALTQIQLTDISYHECPPELAEGTVTPGTTSAANCYIVTGKAENNSNKLVVNADIFGRIYDANGNSILQNRTRLGSIDEVPPGVSDFELRISVPANQPTPLQLKQFKASGFTGKVRR